MATERNLLFAVLAFESELLDLAQLTSACRAWAADKSKLLADLLVERGWITAEDRGFVEKQLERKLAKHQHDPRVTLNSVVRGDVCDALKQVEDADIQRSLSSWPSSGPVLVETLIQSEEDKPKSRYTWVSEVGHGGLGRVWLARDNDLVREVALKEIRPGKSAASQEAVRRLIKEAQITGQLQHPNIVPVYEVNRGGRPFYTMKLVKGETLSNAIQRHHEQRRVARSAAPPQPEDPLSMPRLMSVFLSVCDAIGYAHSRGIIHRDLKPENIVLGDYGEAIVLDWGLAKKISERDDGTASVLLTDDAQTNASRAGHAMGSPSWMPPEQAAGRLDEIDQRSDVYGLGAILFHILTGLPPHSGSNVADILQQIIAAPTHHVRYRDPSIPEELDAICAKAMAKDRAERYQSAKDLKTALQEYDVHEASIDIANIAVEHLEKAKQSGGNDYGEYNRALVRFEEALRQWPGNNHAATGLSDACASYARAAFEHGDYTLAQALTLPDDEFRATIKKAAADRVSYRFMKRASIWSFWITCGIFGAIILWSGFNAEGIKKTLETTLGFRERQLSDAEYELGDMCLRAGRLAEAKRHYTKGRWAIMPVALAERYGRNAGFVFPKNFDDKDRELMDAALTEAQKQRESIFQADSSSPYCPYAKGQFFRKYGAYAESIVEFGNVVASVEKLREQKVVKGDFTQFQRMMTQEIELSRLCEKTSKDWTLLESLPDEQQLTICYYVTTA